MLCYIHKGEVIFVFFFTAVGALLPYITVYMKQRGLSSSETGIIYGIMPFIGFFVKPLIGALADKTKKHKLVLICCTLSAGILYCLLLLTPKKETADVKVTTTLQCDSFDSYIKDCHPAFHLHSSKMEAERVCTSERSLTDYMIMNGLDKDNASSMTCEFNCHRSVVPMEKMRMCFTDDVGKSSEDTCKTVWEDAGSDSELIVAIDIVQLWGRKVIDGNTSYNGQACDSFDLKNVSYQGKIYWQAVCYMEIVFECNIICPLQMKLDDSCEEHDFGKTFWIFFVIFFFCNIAFAPMLSLVDAIAYDMLGEKRGHWGLQRSWGTIGFAHFAIGSGIVTYILSTQEVELDYTASFILYLVLNVLACVVVYFLQFSENVHCSQMFKNILPLLKSFHIVVFFFLIASFGIMNAVTEAFLFWYILSLGGNTITIGLCLVANCLPEIIMLMFSGVIIKKIGHMTCFCTGLIAYVVRFFYYSLVTNAWYIIPVELIHCLSFALMYAGASSFASLIAPEGMSATMQGLVSGLYFGFGKL